MDLDLTDRSVLVTGASRGIGRAIAEAFAAEGADLTICARGEEALNATAKEIASTSERRVLPTVIDVTNAEACTVLVAGHVEAFGGLDGLVNNAGATIREGDSDERWRASFELNVLAAVRLAELAKPHLTLSSLGSIVNVSSIYGREAGGPPQYNATKAAQIAMSKAFALDWAAEGIRVNNVAPGSIAFEGGSWGRRLVDDPDGMAQFIDANIPGGRFGVPEEVAAVVTFLASPRASWVLGATVNVDGGQSRSNI